MSDRTPEERVEDLRAIREDAFKVAANIARQFQQLQQHIDRALSAHGVASGEADR